MKNKLYVKALESLFFRDFNVLFDLISLKNVCDDDDDYVVVCECENFLCASFR
jgi:hypothetical protein